MNIITSPFLFIFTQLTQNCPVNLRFHILRSTFFSLIKTIQNYLSNFVLLLLVLGLMGIIVKPFLSELKIAKQLNFLSSTGLLDCRVSEWSEWSPCRSDGGCVGSAMRTRRIIRRQRPGGAPCPPTALTRWCATNCSTPQPHEDWRTNLT